MRTKKLTQEQRIATLEKTVYQLFNYLAIKYHEENKEEE
jgi:hypothetical protein